MGGLDEMPHPGYSHGISFYGLLFPGRMFYYPNAINVWNSRENLKTYFNLTTLQNKVQVSQFSSRIHNHLTPFKRQKTVFIQLINFRFFCKLHFHVSFESNESVKNSNNVCEISFLKI